MARSWRNCFTLFVIILTLIATSIAVIPNFGLRNATHTSGGIHMKFTGLLSQNFANFIDPLKQLQLTDCYGKWRINSHDASRDLTAYDYSIDELNRITDMNASNQTRIYQNQVKPPNSLTRHGRIIIQSDADFASQGWSGNGTRENPYHIADLQFIVSFTRTMVEISNTRVHFIVSNCWMEKVPGANVEIGIELTNVTNGVIANTIFTDLDSAVIILSSEANDIVNNSCFNIDEGFTVSYSNTINLINNTCTDTHIGIYLLNSNTTSLFNNTCTNSRRGILIRESHAITITNNTCFDADFGLLIFDSFSTEIINNTINNSRYFGCEIYPVNDNILANNSLVNCGFFFGSWEERSWVGFTDAPTNWGVGSFVDMNTQITGNTVNQRPLLLWVGRVDFTVPLGAGQVILLNCSIVTVKNQYLSDASLGIFLCFTSRTRVFNNTCTGHSANGIRMQNCEYITVNNNLCTNNSVSGITLDQTWDTDLINNQCNNNNPSGGRGIRLFESYDNELLNNTCNHNRCGILLESASGNQLLNNTCNHNQELWERGGSGEGISIYGDENTVRLNRCSGNWVGIEIRGQDNNVLENTCTNNSSGIYLGSDTTPVSDNLCVNNSIGIYIYGYRDLIITNNTMIHCGLYLYYLGREWIEPVDISDNTVNGHPLVFLKNCVNIQVWSRAGQIILFNCRGITVREQSLTDCSYGLLVYCTNHSLFKDNWLGNNEEHGILVRDSHNNHFTRNIFSNNDGYGIYLYGGCQNNIVEWNIFLCNASHDARDHGPDFQTLGANIFDYNYWANYSGNSVIFSGFGDIPYNISGNAGNCDLHPLITPFSVLVLQSAEQLLLLFEGVVILVIVIVVFVLIRRKFRRHPLSSAAILFQR